jgi:HAMP domain-containing protein
MARRAVTVRAVRAGRAASRQARANMVRFAHSCAERRVDRRQRTRDRLETGMMKTWPTAPMSVGTSKTWHCVRVSTGISTVLKPDLIVLGHPCQCAGTMSAPGPGRRIAARTHMAVFRSGPDQPRVRRD